MIITARFKLMMLPDDIKKAHGIRSKSRLDCVAFSGGYNGLKCFLNLQGQLFFYRVPARNFVKADSHRIAEWALTNGSINLTSIYIEDVDYPEFGYGYPNGDRFLKNGKDNPLFPYRLDAYLFIVNKDYSQIELFIIQDGRNLISAHYQSLIDGGFSAEIDKLRRESGPFFDYGFSSMDSL